MILKRGNKGGLVWDLQFALQTSGAAPGSIDGDFGRKTEQFVKDYQTSKANLVVDGIAGHGTLRLLGLAYISAIIDDIEARDRLGKSENVTWLLRNGGIGYKTYNREVRGDQFGTRKTIDNIVELGMLWHRFSPAYDFQVGDISYYFGGRTPDHASHRSGRDVDIRPFRKDGEYLPVSCSGEEYDQDLTRKFLSLVKKTFGIGVYFNDPVLIKEGLCRHASGYNDHLHLMFNP